MNKKLLLILSIFLIVGTIINVQGNKEEESKCNVNYYNQSQIYKIAKDVVDIKPYEKDIWDCSDMTDELVIRLRKLGYKTEYIHGFKIVDGEELPHAWTRITVDIESTTGKRIQLEELKRGYKE